MANKQEERLTIKEAAGLLGCQEQYVRTLIRNGKFKPTKAKVGESDTVWRWEIPIDQLEKYKATAGNRTRRPDGRSKYVLYATPEELERINELVAEAELEIIIDRAYKPKANGDKE